MYPADPINQNDLTGLCESAEAWCVVGILFGEEELPSGFAAWLKERSGSFVYYVDTENGNRAALSTGSCSAPGAGDFVRDFRDSCTTHDVGYDLMRFFDSSGKWGGTRRAVDNLLKDDLGGVCRSVALCRGPGCEIVAVTYVAGVRGYSLRQRYRVP